MANYLSPGVYRKETDLSQIIPTVATAIGSIVGASSKGPANTPILVTSTKQFKELFGKPNAKVSFMHYAALAFLEEANNLWVVRATSSDATYGAVLLQKKGAAAPNLFATTTLNPAAFDFSASINGSTLPTDNLALFYAVGPGAYANTLRIETVSENLSAPSGVAAAIVASGGVLGAGTYSYKVTARNAIGETLASTAATATITTGTVNSISVTWPAVAGATAYTVYGRTSGTELRLSTVTTNSFVDTGALTPAGALPTEGATTDEFTVKIYDTEVNAVVPAETFVCTLGNKVDGFGAQMELEQRINNQSTLVKVINAAKNFVTIPTLASVAKTTLGTGTSGTAVTDSTINNGWSLFNDPEKITIRMMINGGYSSPTVQLHMDTVAHNRQDCVAILDMPSTMQSVQSALNYRMETLNLNSNRAAIYTPDLYINDNDNDIKLYVPPSGHIAAVYARNDYMAEAWFAPAGLNRGLLNILGLRWLYNQGDRDVLSPAQINHIRKFPGQGYAVWEQVTMQAKTSALSYVNVRRLLDVIGVAVEKALYYSVFDPNDDILRAQIVGMIGQFLENVKNRRGLYRYLVVCDKSNNSDYTTASGQLNVDVYLDPVIPASKIQLNLVITRTGMSFTEAIVAGGSN